MQRIGDTIGSEFNPDEYHHIPCRDKKPDSENVLDQIAKYLGKDEVLKIITKHELPFSIVQYDMQEPPGFAGDVVKWINQSSLYQRKDLAVITALTAIGNVAGLKYRDDISNVTTNLLSVCVAGTGTGKDWMIDAFKEIMDSVGYGGACCGDMKSKQEIIRNLIDHQAAFYVKDEIGEILRAIENAKKKGGAAYMEGITGEIMSIFTKANTSLQVGGDVKRELVKDLKNEMSFLKKKIEENEDESGYCAARLRSIEPLFKSIYEKGSLPRPFLSLIGYSTIEAFEGSINLEVVKNGFLNRTIIIEEPETNPKVNRTYNPVPFPYSDVMSGIKATGTCSQFDDRVEYYGDVSRIKSTPEARELLLNLQDWQWEYAEYHKEKTGYESLARRSYEFISKISTILAVGDSAIRTVDHVKWSAAYIKRDIENKIGLATYATGKQEGAHHDDVSDSLESRALHLASQDKGIFRSALIQKLKRKGLDKTKIGHFIDRLIDQGKLWEDGRSIKKI